MLLLDIHLQDESKDSPDFANRLYSGGFNIFRNGGYKAGDVVEVVFQLLNLGNSELRRTKWTGQPGSVYQGYDNQKLFHATSDIVDHNIPILLTWPGHDNVSSKFSKHSDGKVIANFELTQLMIESISQLIITTEPRHLDPGSGLLHSWAIQGATSFTANIKVGTRLG